MFGLQARESTKMEEGLQSSNGSAKILSSEVSSTSSPTPHPLINEAVTETTSEKMQNAWDCDGALKTASKEMETIQNHGMAAKITSDKMRTDRDSAPLGASSPPEAGSDPEKPASSAADAGAAPLSKRQQKRLAKREAYLALLPQLRRAERQRRKEKRAAAVAAGAAPKRPRLTRMAASPCAVRVVIDLSFDELMTDRDLGKCLKQVQRCYAANRRAARPLQLHLTSLDGRARQLMDANDGWRNWDVHAHGEHFLRVLEPAAVTYLSSESEHELAALEPGRAYVIGGLVDHNHHKGVCHRRAEEAGLRHARLPIDQFVEMKTRKVLTIDHVFGILLRVAAGSSWEEAFFAVLPPRKGAVPRRSADGGGAGDGSAAEAEEAAGDGAGDGSAAEAEEAAGGGGGPGGGSADARLPGGGESAELRAGEGAGPGPEGASTGDEVDGGLRGGGRSPGEPSQAAEDGLPAGRQDAEAVSMCPGGGEAPSGDGGTAPESPGDTEGAVRHGESGGDQRGSADKLDTDDRS